MEYFEYYKEALRRYTDFSGRANRAQYWYFVLFNILIMIGLGLVDGMFFDSSNYGPLQSLYNLAVLVPSIAIGVRRLHDINKSGWWLLISLIPLVGFIVLIYFMVQKGDSSENKYGRNPEGVKSVANTKSNKG